MSSKNPLVTTTEKMVKEGINEMETKTNVVREAITTPIATDKIDTFNKTDKPKSFKRKQY